MKRIVLSLIIIAALGAATVQSATMTFNPSKDGSTIDVVMEGNNKLAKIVQNNIGVQQAIAAITGMIVGAGASLLKHPSTEFLKSFGIQGVLQLIPELTNAFGFDYRGSIQLESGINKISLILPFYNLQAALRSMTHEQPDFSGCASHIKSAMRNFIALLAAQGCKQLGQAIHRFVIAK